MKSVSRSRSRSRLPIASAALFMGGLFWIASFWLPVFNTVDGNIPGYWVFVTGWMGFTVFQFAWYANLLMLLAVILMYSSPLRATLIAALGVLVATQAFWFEAIPGSNGSSEIVRQGLGFWLWFGSIILLGVGVVFGSDHTEPDSRYRSKPPRVSLAAAVRPLEGHVHEPDDLVLAELGTTAIACAEPSSSEGMMRKSSASASSVVLSENWPEKISLVVSPQFAKDKNKDKDINVNAWFDDSGEVQPDKDAKEAWFDDNGEVQFYTGKKKAGASPTPFDGVLD